MVFFSFNDITYMNSIRKTKMAGGVARGRYEAVSEMIKLRKPCAVSRVFSTSKRSYPGMRVVKASQAVVVYACFSH